MYSLFGRADFSPIRMHFITIMGVINFYITHFEKYNTGVMYLPVAYDYVMCVSILRGLQMEKILTIFLDNYIERLLCIGYDHHYWSIDMDKPIFWNFATTIFRGGPLQLRAINELVRNFCYFFKERNLPLSDHF